MSLIVKYFESNSTLSSFPKSSTSIRVSIKLPSFLLFDCYFFNNTLQWSRSQQYFYRQTPYLLAARHLKFTAQASHPAVAARQVPTPSALLQALVAHQAVALPVRVVAAKRLQQALIITSGQSSVGLSTNSPGATSSTSTGAGQSCCSFATAECSVL